MRLLYGDKAPEVSISDSRLALASVVADPEGGASGRRRARALLVGGDATDALGAVLRERVGAVESQLAALGWRWVSSEEEGFPPGLAALSDPPLGLFVRGILPSGPAAAVVGARRATAYGREVAEYLGRELAAAGVWVVSGMARGVDGAAHSGALAGGGRTAAVWGCGADRVYPAEHRELAEAITARGCLLTEYPPGVAPLAHHFPERNRLITGLVGVVVVVEADERSGALITARLALDEGRDVMAVPGSVFSRLSAGPNGLLRCGAAPVLSAGDVLAVLGVEAPSAPRDEEPASLALLPAGEALTVDAIAARAGRPVAAILESLLTLELGGWVSREPDGRYRRSHTTRQRVS